VIPAPFEYERAESVGHVFELLGRFGDDAKLLAGGQSLLPLMKLRLAQPSALIDIGRLADLAYVRDEGHHVAIGALTRHEDAHFDEVLKRSCPIIAKAAGEVGDPQVRHLGTIGGSIAHADPASDLPTVLVTLDATFVVRGLDGERSVTASDFFKGTFETELRAGEILTEIRVPKLDGAGWSYQKFHPRAQDWAIVGVAAVVQRSNGGVGRAAVGLTNMGETPLRASGVEQALASGADAAAAAQEATQNTNPVNDPFASAEYRMEMAKVLTRRALEEALSR
jgi:carbon-monoxide dehydrogenase medium subunit